MAVGTPEDVRYHLCPLASKVQAARMMISHAPAA